MARAYAPHAARPAEVPGRIFALLCGVRCAVTVPASMVRERGLHAEESVVAERTETRAELLARAARSFCAQLDPNDMRARLLATRPSG
jgi:hypothetical protein